MCLSEIEECKGLSKGATRDAAIYFTGVDNSVFREGSVKNGVKGFVFQKLVFYPPNNENGNIVIKNAEG